MAVTVFITGATGYIGGAVLYLLLQNKGAYHISALVRDKDKATKLEALGVLPVIGSLDDTAIIVEESRRADVVLHTANADHFGSAKAIVEGLQKKLKETGKKGIYIHTSGSGIVGVVVPGQLAASETIYNDDDDAQMNAIPVKNPHRDVDTFILEHAGDYEAVIVAPTDIYGQGYHLEGISKPISSQIPLAISAAIKNKKAHCIGKGLNVWSNVHVDDVADLYILLLEKLLKGELKDNQKGYYFAENGEHAWVQIHQEIANILHNRGIASDASIVTVNTPEEITKAYGFPQALYYIGSNSRAKANKARKLGWTPKHGGDAVFRTIEKDLDYILAQEKK